MPESVFTQTMPAPFAGGAWWAAAVFEADALAGAAGGGVGESSAVALLSVASAFFGVVIFFRRCGARIRRSLRTGSAGIRLVLLRVLSGGGAGLTLIASLLRRLRPDRDATGDQQDGSDQGEIYAVPLCHIDFSSPPAAADPSCQTYSQESGRWSRWLSGAPGSSSVKWAHVVPELA